jgi:hypothetical protein
MNNKAQTHAYNTDKKLYVKKNSRLCLYDLQTRNKKYQRLVIAFVPYCGTQKMFSNVSPPPLPKSLPLLIKK